MSVNRVSITDVQTGSLPKNVVPIRQSDGLAPPSSVTAGDSPFAQLPNVIEGVSLGVEPTGVVTPSELDLAFYNIQFAADGELTIVERSNHFDDWKRQMQALAEGSSAATIQFRQAVGMLLASTNRKDVVDFTPQQLHAFRDITNILRRPNVVDLDVASGLMALDRVGLTAVMPLDASAATPGVEGELDSFLDQLLGKSSR